MSDDNIINLPPPKKRPAGPGRGKKIKQGSGIPASGAGWGGPAKGAGTTTPINEHPDSFAALPPGERKAKLVDKAAAAERALVIYESIMENEAEMASNRISAANALLNRIEGMPVARSITGTMDDLERMSDADLIAELERANKILAIGGPKAGAAKGKGKSTRMVH